MMSGERYVTDLTSPHRNVTVTDNGTKQDRREDIREEKGTEFSFSLYKVM
jgi:hypothetical protein